MMNMQGSMKQAQMMQKNGRSAKKLAETEVRRIHRRRVVKSYPQRQI